MPVTDGKWEPLTWSMLAIRAAGEGRPASSIQVDLVMKFLRGEADGEESALVWQMKPEIVLAIALVNGARKITVEVE